MLAVLDSLYCVGMLVFESLFYHTNSSYRRLQALDCDLILFNLYDVLQPASEAFLIYFFGGRGFAQERSGTSFQRTLLRLR